MTYRGKTVLNLIVYVHQKQILWLPVLFERHEVILIQKLKVRNINTLTSLSVKNAEVCLFIRPLISNVKDDLIEQEKLMFSFTVAISVRL